MPRLTELAHELCSKVIGRGDVVVDATAGNGHDTLFLARQVGPDGMVYAFDVQEQALRATAERLKLNGLDNALLLQRSHDELLEAVPAEHHGRVTAVMFNLGYLPGGDKTVVTSLSSTIPALDQSLNLLQNGGVLTVLCYTGHDGAERETAAVGRYLAGLDALSYGIQQFAAPPGSIAPPRLFAVEKI